MRLVRSGNSRSWCPVTMGLRFSAGVLFASQLESSLLAAEIERQYLVYNKVCDWYA